MLYPSEGMSRRKRQLWTFSDSDGLLMEAIESSPRTLETKELYAVYQPIVDVIERRVYAHEMLARCSRPGLERPDELFAKARAEQFVGRLGRMVRTVGLPEGRREPLFVNIHPDELAARWLVRPDDPLNSYGGPLFLEITEAAALAYYELCRDVLREVCRRIGATIVVDDLGAGYSNLRRIVDLEPGVVKLDRELIRGLHRLPRQRILVSRIALLCHDLGAQVVAEGVERPEEMQACIDCGIRLIQGYLLAKPSRDFDFVWPEGL